MDTSYIKLYRKIKNTSVWCDSDKLKLWIYCLTEATHKERVYLLDNQKIELKKGQFITGRTKLEEDFNRGVSKKNKVSGKTLFRWIEVFQDCEMLSIKSTNKYSIITVLNWDKYQQNDQQLSNSCPTNDQQLSNSCPQNKNEKNVNNDKNEKKERYGILQNVMLTQEEYLKIEEQNAISYIDDLSVYIPNKKGKPYQSHYATILNWKRRDDKKREEFGIKQEWSNEEKEISEKEKLEMIEQIKEMRKGKQKYEN